MRVFEDSSSTGVSQEFGSTDTQQVALNFSVEGDSDVSATLILQALTAGVWSTLLTKMAFTPIG